MSEKIDGYHVNDVYRRDHEWELTCFDRDILEY